MMTPEDVKKFYAPENEKTSCGKMITSPLGKYTLFISYFGTGPNTWNVSRGQVYESGIDRPPVYSKMLVRKPALIETVHRNYGSFPFLFVENHPNGHDYLICGENYMSQTVIELDTRKRIELPTGTSQFCWAHYEFNQDEKLIIVDGCFWAAPYEIKIYDFSDPMNGWPELEIESPNDCFYPQEMPTIKDGLFIFSEHKNVHDIDILGCDEYEKLSEEEQEKKILAATTTFKREGNKLVFVEEWISDAEQAYRKQQAEWSALHKAKMAKFYSEDPLYLTTQDQLKDPFFNPGEWYKSIGQTYPDWCPDWPGKEQRMCMRILEKKNSHTVDLEWAMETGPIKLVIYKDDKKQSDKFFMEHSAESMKQAFDYVRNLK